MSDHAEELARRAEELRILRRVSQEIASTLDLEEIFRITLATVDELFGFQHTLLSLLDDSGETLTVVASRGYDDPVLGAKIGVGVGVIGMVAKKRRLSHISNLGRYRSYVSAQRRRMVEAGRSGEIGAAMSLPGLPDVESQVAVPLLAKEALIGVLSVESPMPRAFSEQDEGLISIVANQAATAIHSARARHDLQRARDELELRVEERTAKIERELRVAQELLRDARRRVEGPLLGESLAVRELREGIARFAATDDAIVIVGPPGSGKEAAARAIHADSARAEGTFIHVHCPLLQVRDRSALFGSTLGWQAGQPEPGHAKFDLAAGGTLYLEAANELPLPLQADLAEVLERHAAAPPVRVILGMADDPRRETRERHLDQDLYHRLGGRELRVPALRERPEDIEAIAAYFVREHARQLGRNVDRLSPRSLRRLQAYRWPGNVRELRHVLERAVILAQDSVLEIEEEALGEGISLGSYRLVRQVGSGGMGEVWLARHSLLARPAAVKLIRSIAGDGQAETALRARFRREAEVTARLHSPHTVQLYDFGVSETGTFYYVMEFLRGLDLAHMIRRFGPLPAERTTHLLRQACSSLAEAHGRGLVHRDIKPANLFVTALGSEYDVLKVLDFGVVKGTRGETTPDLTLTGQAQGTPAFMAPELALAEPGLDGRADLYSLGCVAFWMLTGLLVFESENATRMVMDHVQTEPRPPSTCSELEIPEELDAIVLRCLAKRPAGRFASAADLRDALGRVPLRSPWTESRARDWWMAHGSELLADPETPRGDDVDGPVPAA